MEHTALPNMPILGPVVRVAIVQLIIAIIITIDYQRTTIIHLRFDVLYPQPRLIGPRH